VAKLTYQQRKNLPKKSFVFPGKAPGPGSYPIPDEAHARNALARVSQHGTPSERAAVRAAVHRKFPNIGKAEEGVVIEGRDIFKDIADLIGSGWAEEDGKA